MNNVINNLPTIASAAEYFDRKVGSAWRIRTAISNALIWSCNSYLYAIKTDDADRIMRCMVTISTLRTWARDCDQNALQLDLTERGVAKTLGIDREVDVHEEALRIAKGKCIRARSAAKFKDFYQAAFAAVDEQQKQRRDSVAEIAELCSDTGWQQPCQEVVDAYERHYTGSCHPFVADRFTMPLNDLAVEAGDSYDDEDTPRAFFGLYDDDMVQEHADKIQEAVAHAVQLMHDECDAELTAAITTSKIARLEGFMASIKRMMEVCGLDMKRYADRTAKLKAQIDAAWGEVNTEAQCLQAAVEAQINEMSTPPEPAKEPKAKVIKTIKAAKAAKAA